MLNLMFISLLVKLCFTSSLAGISEWFKEATWGFITVLILLNGTLGLWLCLEKMSEGLLTFDLCLMSD